MDSSDLLKAPGGDCTKIRAQDGAAEFDGTYVWGRGALDDKSGVIAILEAVNYLLEKNFSPRRTVYLSFGHDEEIGGRRGAGKVTEFLLNEGVELEWTLDEGSFLLKDIIPGVNKPVAVINVAEKGSLTIQVIGKAEGGHSSMLSSVWYGPGVRRSRSVPRGTVG